MYASGPTKPVIAGAVAAANASVCACVLAATFGAYADVSIPVKVEGTAPAPNLSIDFKKAVSEPSIIGAVLLL